MEHFKFILWASLALSLSACTVRSDLHLSLATLSGGPPKIYSKADAMTSVVGRHCESYSISPVHWKVDSELALKSALEKVPGAVALSNVTITQSMYFYFVRSLVCTEVSGTPLFIAEQ